MSEENYKFHKPVLLKEVLEILDPEDGKIYIDGTFGAGGYSKAILQKAKCKVYGFDRDAEVKKLLLICKKNLPEDFILFTANFP